MLPLVDWDTTDIARNCRRPFSKLTIPCTRAQSPYQARREPLARGYTRPRECAAVGSNPRPCRTWAEQESCSAYYPYKTAF